MSAIVRKAEPALVVLALLAAAVLPFVGILSVYAGITVGLGLLLLARLDAGTITVRIAGACALRRAATTGVVVRDPGALERAARIETVAFDSCPSLAIPVTKEGVGPLDRVSRSLRDVIDQLDALGVLTAVREPGSDGVPAWSRATPPGAAGLRPMLGCRVALVSDASSGPPSFSDADLHISTGWPGPDTTSVGADVVISDADPANVAGLIGLARWHRVIALRGLTLVVLAKTVAAVLLFGVVLPLWAVVALEAALWVVVVESSARIARDAPRRPKGPVLPLQPPPAPVHFV